MLQELIGKNIGGIYPLKQGFAFYDETYLKDISIV